MGGLRKLIPGQGIEDGSFEELPSVEINRPQGPTLTGEPLLPNFKFNPGKYKQAKVNSPFVDFLTGGEGSRAANAQNAQAQLTMQQIAAAQALQQAQMEAEFARTGMDNSSRYRVQELQNQGMAERERLQGRYGMLQNNQMSRNRIREGDAGMLNKQGLPSSSLEGYTSRVAPHTLTRAEVESRNAEGFAQEPEGIASQRANYNAVLRQPQAENFSKTRSVIQPNERLFVPGLNGEVSGTMLNGNTTGEQIIQTPKTFPDGKGGYINLGNEINTVRTTTPGAPAESVISPEERKRREIERLRQIQAMNQYRSAQAGTDPNALNALVNYLKNGGMQ